MATVDMLSKRARAQALVLRNTVACAASGRAATATEAKRQGLQPCEHPGRPSTNQPASPTAASDYASRVVAQGERDKTFERRGNPGALFRERCGRNRRDVARFGGLGRQYRAIPVAHVAPGASPICLRRRRLQALTMQQPTLPQAQANSLPRRAVPTPLSACEWRGGPRGESSVATPRFTGSTRPSTCSSCGPRGFAAGCCSSSPALLRSACWLQTQPNLIWRFLLTAQWSWHPRAQAP